MERWASAGSVENGLKDGGREGMSVSDARDAKYADIRERKRRVEWVRRELKDYWWELTEHTGKWAVVKTESAEEQATHTGKWVVDPTESAEKQVTEEKRARYYDLGTESGRAFWGPAFWFAQEMGLGEEERRVKEVVMPKMKEARGLVVERVWFLYGEKLIEIDDFVQKWFGAQTADKEARAQVSWALYELCEYRARDAPRLAGLAALKEACYDVYVAVWMVSESVAQWQLVRLLKRVWELPAEREEFETAGAAGKQGRRGREAARQERR